MIPAPCRGFPGMLGLVRVPTSSTLRSGLRRLCSSRCTSSCSSTSISLRRSNSYTDVVSQLGFVNFLVEPASCRHPNSLKKWTSKRNFAPVPEYPAAYQNRRVLGSSPAIRQAPIHLPPFLCLQNFITYMLH
jgi:hypothetical protein